MKKIIVIGAGQGGLRAAQVLAAGGADVSVFEKSSEEKIGFDWFDGVSVKLFRDLGIPVPADSFKGFSPSFFAPGSDKPLFVCTDPEKADWSVNKRSLTRQLIAAARESGAKLFFETAVEGLIFSNTAVTGVKVNGEALAADLVIDSSGIYSPFRASLPSRAGITKMPREDEVFNVYRGIYSQTPGFPELPEKRKFKMYLKYQGKMSISWCGVEPSGELNVLVGMIGRLDLNDFNQLYAHLKMDNPIIDCVIGDRSAEVPIPVRYPLSRFAFPGYAAVGDAAFMTIPIMGSGIENSLRAGQMLADAILADGSVSMETLWKYQVKYYRSIGAVCCLLDWVKRGLLASDNGELKKFIESGAVSEEDIKAVMFGKISEIPLKELTEKPAKLFASRKMLGGLAKYIAKGISAAVAAAAIPKGSSPTAVSKWAGRLERAMEE